MQFRTAMLAPDGVDQKRFRQYLKSIQEPTSLLLQDLQLWLEIQRYKGLCHTHCSKRLVRDKV